MLATDDLGASTDFATRIGRHVAAFENATAYVRVNSANGDGPTLPTVDAPVFATRAARGWTPGVGVGLAWSDGGSGPRIIPRDDRSGDAAAKEVLG